MGWAAEKAATVVKALLHDRELRQGGFLAAVPLGLAFCGRLAAPAAQFSEPSQDCQGTAGEPAAKRKQAKPKRATNAQLAEQLGSLLTLTPALTQQVGNR